MRDNLNIHGIESDAPQGRHGSKPRGKRRKPWAIEWRIQQKAGLARTLRLNNWSVYTRYLTEARRDQAYAALVKKTKNDYWGQRFGWITEYRKRDD